MPENLVDQIARDMAQASLNRIDTHEKLCTLRAEEAKDARIRIERGVAGLYGRIWIAAGGIIVALASAAGTLALIVMMHK